MNPATRGTKVGARYPLRLEPGETASLRLRYTNRAQTEPVRRTSTPCSSGARARPTSSSRPSRRVRSRRDERRVFRAALAGLHWTQAVLRVDVERWLRGDPTHPPPPEARRKGRNREWRHLYNCEVLSMPDKWEYPWYAAWDLAFHCIPLALVDPEFAKQQLTLLTREWYMHPNGQLPAYEWQFGDVNPPVHAWAALRVYQIERRTTGRGDRAFLESIFLKLMLNFTWWVNRKDTSGSNVFEGGFLGLDNIGVFDRSKPLPGGGVLEQADATSWMGMYCLNMLDIALELARENDSYQDVANKFFEHFLLIAHAMNHIGRAAPACGTRSTASTTTSCAAPRGRASRARPLDGGTHAALRGVDARARHGRALPGVLAARAVVPAEPARAGRALPAHGGAGPEAAEAAVPGRQDEARARPLAHAERGGVPLALRGPFAVAGARPSSPTSSPSTASTSASTTSRPRAAPASSAETRTGAARCGCR